MKKTLKFTYRNPLTGRRKTYKALKFVGKLDLNTKELPNKKHVETTQAKAIRGLSSTHERTTEELVSKYKRLIIKRSGISSRNTKTRHELMYKLYSWVNKNAGQLMKLELQNL